MAGETAAGPLRVWRERDGRLLRLRLSRPKANVVDAEMIGALDAAFAAAERPEPGQPALRGILLDAEGPHFSFGASVAEHLPGKEAAMLAAIHGLVLRMLAHPVPILVAIRGQCLGGGLELACAGHLLFSTPEARMGQPEIILGVFPPAASCLLPERIARAHAEDLLLSGRTVDGAEAARIGLVNATAADPEAAALAWFEAHVGKHSAAVVRLGLQAARADMVERVRAKLAGLERLYLEKLMKTHDAVEGLTAFLEKRPARWEDR
jgi:cyclohexa-1,5-dienecarbonyl-CoA hydratase